MYWKEQNSAPPQEFQFVVSFVFWDRNALQTFQVVCFRNTSKHRSFSTAHASCKILKYLELVKTHEYFELLKSAYALSICLAYKEMSAVGRHGNQMFNAAVTHWEVGSGVPTVLSDHPMQYSKKPYGYFEQLHFMFLLSRYFGCILLNCINVDITFCFLNVL